MTDLFVKRSISYFKEKKEKKGKTEKMTVEVKEPQVQKIKKDNENKTIIKKEKDIKVKEIKEKEKEKAMEIAFIDLSYFVIHKYFGVLSWQKFSKLDLTKEEIRERYSKSFEDSIVKFQRRYRFDWSRLYLSKDTPRDQIWRVNLCETYKDRKDFPLRSDFDPAIFGYTYEILIPSLREKYGGFEILETHGAEADDVVAIAHRLLRKKGKDKETLIFVVTNDNDYVQLHDANTTIVNANGLDLTSRFTTEMLSVYTLWKVIKGDVSDCVPSIAPKIGDKTALKLALSPDLLKKKLDSNPTTQAQFDLNKTLIAFDSIPEDIVNNIEAMLNRSTLFKG